MRQKGLFLPGRYYIELRLKDLVLFSDPLVYLARTFISLIVRGVSERLNYDKETCGKNM